MLPRSFPLPCSAGMRARDVCTYVCMHMCIFPAERRSAIKTSGIGFTWGLRARPRRGCKANSPRGNICRSRSVLFARWPSKTIMKKETTGVPWRYFSRSVDVLPREINRHDVFLDDGSSQPRGLGVRYYSLQNLLNDGAIRWSVSSFAYSFTMQRSFARRKYETIDI